MTRDSRLSAADCEKVLKRARELTISSIQYDPAYVTLRYPSGDVPKDTGVCTDVLIRSFREVGFDFQKKVHEDMNSSFVAYPKIWNQTKSDRSIDHRRVPNLMTYLYRNHSALSLEQNPSVFKACDIVAWNLGGGVPHVGIVSDKKNLSGKNLKIIHHLSGFPKEEDVIFDWRIIGHFAL